MSKMTDTTRRCFLKSGAIVAAPLAAVAAPAVAKAAGDGSAARLARLEDERAIEALNRDFLRRFNREGLERTAELFADGKAPGITGEMNRLSLDPAAEPELFELSKDGSTAHMRQVCLVESDHPLEGEETLVQMARLQGNSASRARSGKTLVANYRKQGERWTITKLELV